MYVRGEGVHICVELEGDQVVCWLVVSIALAMKEVCGSKYLNEEAWRGIWARIELKGRGTMVQRQRQRVVL